MVAGQPSNKRVDKAGRRLRRSLTGRTTGLDPEVLEEDKHVVNAFRSSHRQPMNAASMGLRSFVRTAKCREPSISQRLKRWESLSTKLVAQPTLALSRMQDIAGCRAVLADLDEIRRVQQRIEKNRPVLSVVDYISHPKASGYRGVHVVVEYGGTGGKYPPRPVEIQLRTKWMHEWAITVEQMTALLAPVESGPVDLKRGIGLQEALDLLSVISEVMAARELAVEAGSDTLKRLEAARAAYVAYLRRKA